MNYHIIEMGAAGDGKNNDAPIIQKAIDLCHAQGGGLVVLDLPVRIYYFKESCGTGRGNRSNIKSERRFTGL